MARDKEVVGLNKAIRDLNWLEPAIKANPWSDTIDG